MDYYNQMLLLYFLILRSKQSSYFICLYNYILQWNQNQKGNRQTTTQPMQIAPSKQRQQPIKTLTTNQQQPSPLCHHFLFLHQSARASHPPPHYRTVSRSPLTQTLTPVCTVPTVLMPQWLIPISMEPLNPGHLRTPGLGEIIRGTLEGIITIRIPGSLAFIQELITQRCPHMVMKHCSIRIIVCFSAFFMILHSILHIVQLCILLGHVLIN